jgi:hypothetical protein
MKRMLLVLGVLMASFVSASPVHAAAGGISCHEINATASGQDSGNNSTGAQVLGGGLLHGTLVATFSPTGGGLFTGTETFRTRQGTLTVGITASFNFTTGDFAASGPVTGATGKLAGATGSLSFAGNENLQSGSFSERITGSICVDLSP